MKAVGFMVYHPGGWEYFQADERERADKFAQALAIETGKAIAVYTRRGAILKTHYPLGPVHSGAARTETAL